MQGYYSSCFWAQLESSKAPGKRFVQFYVEAKSPFVLLFLWLFIIRIISYHLIFLLWTVLEGKQKLQMSNFLFRFSPFHECFSFPLFSVLSVIFTTPFWSISQSWKTKTNGLIRSFFVIFCETLKGFCFFLSNERSQKASWNWGEPRGVCTSLISRHSSVFSVSS